MDLHCTDYRSIRIKVSPFPKRITFAQLDFRFETTLTLALSLKGAFTSSSSFSETPCVLCSKPVDLRIDLTADENGKAVHEHCYVNHIASSRSNPPATMVAD
jgi:hypothetical protein